MRRAAAAAALVLSATCPAVVTEPAHANDEAGPWLVGTSSVTDLLVDDATGRVFVTGYADGKELTVIEPTSGERRRLPVSSRVGSLTMTADGRTVLGSAGHSVVAVDPVTLAVTEHPLPSEVCLDGLVDAAGSWWFVDRCGIEQLSALDPATGVLTQGLAAATRGQLAASPQHEDVMFLGARNELTRLRVAGGVDPTVTREASTPVRSESLDLVVAPDGGTVISVPDYGSATAYSAADLSVIRSYTYGEMADVRDDGMVAVAHRDRITTYAAGSTVPLRVYRGEELGALVAVDFSGDRLYSLEDSRPAEVRVRLPRPASRLSVARHGAKTFDYRRVWVDVTLEAGEATNRRVHFYYDRGNRTPRSHLRSVEVPAAGQMRVRVPMESSGYLVARYQGDETVDEAEDSVFVEVRAVVRNRAVRYEQTRGDTHLVPLSRRAWIQGSVLPEQPARCAHLQVQLRVDGRWRGRYDKCFHLGSDSRVRVGLSATRELVGVPMRMRLRSDSLPGTEDIGRVDVGYGPWVRYLFTG